ncbi:FtsX-like permease family protein [Dethiothermospora halolimnae]|uniref:FtsX-like permease family protein n=1 Tax=Dethiothermospora halolimnae TaxID=3114390 RepID=UPI003CCB7401
MVLAILVSILITSLFLKMLIAKDSSQIAIMRSIGISLRDIQIQYITRGLIVLNLGIIIGTVISNTLGEKILSLILSIIGAYKIEFTVNPIEAYLFTPVMLMTVVTITTFSKKRDIR